MKLKPRKLYLQYGYCTHEQVKHRQCCSSPIGFTIIPHFSRVGKKLKLMVSPILLNSFLFQGHITRMI